MRLAPTLMMLSLAGSTPALAQPQVDREAERPGHRALDLSAMRAARGNDMALLIGLRPDQRASLDAMLAATMPPRPPMARRGDGDDDAASGPPPAETQDFATRLAHMEQRAGERTRREAQRIAALRTFYVGLDAQQQARFDALMRLSHPPMGRPGPRDARPPAAPPRD